MRVLLTGFDLFGSVGGGQTFYRGVIARNPHIEFHYFRQHESEHAARPANAHAIAFRSVYLHEDLSNHVEPGPPAETHSDYLLANNIARAVAGRTFDVVDSPDYERSGVFLRGALRRHGVAFGKLALSMHGVVSTTIAMNWWGDGRLPVGLKRREWLHYAAADLRYFISPSYQQEWAELAPGLESHHLDPMRFFTPPPRAAKSDRSGPPALYFIGRTERRKGPHYFVQMLWWLPRHTYSRGMIVGPDCHDWATEVRSSTLLQKMIDARRLGEAVVQQPAMNCAELATVFASKAVTFLPSGYDTFNLVALESLLSGCPTVIGSGAGVCRYLRERFPEIPFVEFDTTRFFGSLPAIEDLLADYDRRREELEAAVARADLTPIGPQLSDIYSARGDTDPIALAECEEWDRRLTQGMRQLKAA